MIHWLVIILVGFIFIVGTAQNAGAGSYWVETKDLRVCLTDKGEIAGMAFDKDEEVVPVAAQTVLVNCLREDAVDIVALDDGGLKITKRFVNQEGGQKATMIEYFRPGKNSVRWELEILSNDDYWSAPIETHWRWPDEAGSLFWTAWGDAHGKEDEWSDPLAPQPWADRDFRYGGHSYFKEPGTFSLPLATILTPKDDRGISLVLSPEDLILTMNMRTTRQGEVAFSRLYHRLGESRVVHCALDIIAHKADWRGGAGWLVDRYPDYFNPENPQAHRMGGCGSYSSHANISDVERLMRMAYRVNWKASFDFPFMGMFIPPVTSDTQTWTDYKQQQASIAKMRTTAWEFRQQGFYLLNYFNVTELGMHYSWPPPKRKSEHDEDLWRDANDFLFYAMGDAILPNAEGKPIGSWVGCVVMDAGEKVYQDHLIEQARRHIECFPDSSGICIDRMDWIWCYNRRRDDGVTWFEDKPARSLVVSWRNLMERLSPVMHHAGKVIFSNPMYVRPDLMKSIDGFYDEHGQHPTSLNTTCLLALRKPIMAWTWELDRFDNNTDAYFQRHLHLGCYLTAPVPGNDHTILPDSKRDQYYYDYGPLLDAMRGKRWMLTEHVISVEGDKALANLFEVPGGYVAPITFGAEAASVRVQLQGLPILPGQKGFCFQAILPSEQKSIDLKASEKTGVWIIDVPLKRGCAMLTLKHTWLEPTASYFANCVSVKLDSTLKEIEWHYTLDGGEPSVDSTSYNGPFELMQTAFVRAAAFHGKEKIGLTLEKEYVKLPPSEAD
ncbi:MAG: chitobiase/beta-hexosaminidase C-terminal domain-containing protein [Sedimentisphaerales bacterium]|nr:chitobiase/beta-hexosaminidase C-terminal domain-containing protein [Sedimentisphaerales bacterium]